MTGTLALIRLILRRDRFLLPIWIVVAALIPLGVAAGFLKLYPTAEALRAYAEEVTSNPTIRAMLGPVFAPSVGGLTAWRTGMQGVFAAGLPSLFLVVRYTRSEEEAGRRELLGSTAISRKAPLTAALAVVLAANLAIAILVAAELIALGLPLPGSVAHGLSWAATGWVFGALGAVVAQMVEHASTAIGIGSTVLGVLFVTRMAGDAGGEHGRLSWLSWLSPVGWVRLIRAFAGERWWIFALFGGLVLVLTAAAYALYSRRDLGAGLIQASPGPATAPRSLRGPLSLAWRLNRRDLLAWTITATTLGVLLGAVGTSMSNLLSTPAVNIWMLRMGAHSSGDAFLGIIIYTLGQVSTAYAIQTALQVRFEELSGAADSILATSISRLRWASSHLAFAAIGPMIAMATLGFAVGLTFGVSTGKLVYELTHILGRAIALVPAIWVMAALTTALIGFVPRIAVPASWGALTAVLLLELAWEMRQVSDSVFDISPFAHVHWSAAAIGEARVAWLLGVAAMLTVAGLLGFNRRDIR